MTGSIKYVDTSAFVVKGTAATIELVFDTFTWVANQRAQTNDKPYLDTPIVHVKDAAGNVIANSCVSGVPKVTATIKSVRLGGVALVDHLAIVFFCDPLDFDHLILTDIFWTSCCFWTTCGIFFWANAWLLCRGPATAAPFNTGTRFTSKIRVGPGVGRNISATWPFQPT